MNIVDSSRLHKNGGNRKVISVSQRQAATLDIALSRTLAAVEREITREKLEKTLRKYSGWNFGSLQTNQEFTKKVRELLEENGLRVKCAICAFPSILRCQPAGNSKTGAFMYDHYLENGRTFHGGPSTFPHVTLVDKPHRRKNGTQ